MCDSFYNRPVNLPDSGGNVSPPSADNTHLPARRTGENVRSMTS
ncbi:MAG: hypothetical protein Q8K98_11180 [Bacteroidota bacterium]|nr:hypothetical protein [Bacteroidota bacterium]